MTCEEEETEGADAAGAWPLHSVRETLGWESTPPVDVHLGRIHCGQFSVFVFLQDATESQGVLVVPASHRVDFERPEGCMPGSCVRVAPVRAGDCLLVTNALTRGVVRAKHAVEFRYEFQFAGAVPAALPPAVAERLSDHTKVLMEYAHVLHTKPLAADWVQTFYPARL
eukprot:SAG22_NODE_2471_length_2534_cov_1.657495_3_plen_169_part_00